MIITTSPILHSINSVKETETVGVYIVEVDLTDIYGERYVCDYVSADNDTFGLAPKVREAVLQWISEGKEVLPYTVPPVTSDDINMERTRRIQLGSNINGIYVTGRDEDIRNLTNLALGAQLRLSQGDNTTITIYRDGHNVDHSLTPIQILGLWQTASNYVSNIYAKSWALKAMEPIPQDYTDDSYWI